MIGTIILLPHLGAKPLSTRMATHKDHGHPAALMLSIWGRQKIITDATIITFPTHDRVSGYRELFPQHCQLPSMTPHQHFCTLTDELTEHTAQANSTPKGQHLLKLLGTRIETLLHPPPILEEQKVIAERQHYL